MLKESRLSAYKVKDVRHLHTEFPVCIKQNEEISVVLKSGISEKHCRNIYVVNDDNQLVGVIRMKEMLQNIFPMTAMSEGSNLNIRNIPVMRATIASELMLKKPACVSEDTPLNKTVLTLLRENLLELPVVDHDGKIIGQLDASEVIAFSLSSEE